MSTKSFWVVYNLAQTLHKQVDALVKERVGLGLAQYKVLEAIGYKGIAKQNELAEMLNQTEAGISRQVKLLWQKGLIIYTGSQKRSSGSDVALTRIGEEVVNLAYQVIDSYTAALESEIPPDSLKAAQQILGKMGDSAEQQAKEREF